MYCLEKLQRELAHFLDIDLNTLPKVQEILKAQGYSAVKKNDEIIELGSARQSFLEKEILNAESIVKGADIIGDFRQQAGSAKHKSPTSTADSTTKQVFNQGDDVVSSEILPQPNKQTFESFKQSLESQGIPIESEVKSFINFVEKNIYNEKGVSFNQLNNALKTLNSYYKQAQDPNFKNHIKNAMDSFLREDIKAGIEAIFSQNKTAYKDISSLYASALSDYADMKEVLKIADKLKIRNATTEQNKALDSLLKLAKGQGDKQDNISSLTKALDKDNRALIELNMLQSLFQKSLYDDNALQVIDSGKFFKELQALHKDTFQSKEAQDFINIMTDFDKLFKNDILIAKALRPTTTGQIGSSIATSIEGAVKFQVVKSAFSHLVRLMPHIPFMNGLNQKVQGTALRYHLQKALENSFSVSDLKHTLQNRIAKAPYTSQTKSQIDKILNRVDKAQDELIEVAEKNALTTQRKNLLDKLQYLKGTQATNKTDGRIAYISKDGLEKMLSGKAIGKSLDNGFSLDNHLQAVENVLDLFANAIFMQSQKPNNNSADIIAFHKYLAPFKNADVKLTIKEINQNGNKIYSLELLEMSPVFKRNLPNASTQETKDIIHTGEDRLSEASTPNNTLELQKNVNAPKMQVHSQAIGEQYSKSRKPEPMHPDTPLENPNSIIPQTQIPKDNSDPAKTFEYFRDDFIRGYDEALKTFEGKRPLVSTIPYKALDPIIEARTALVKEANDGFKKILQKAGFPDDVIQEKFMKTLTFGDIDYNLQRIRGYFGQVKKNLHQYDETHKPMAEKLLKQKDEVIRLYESRFPAEQELEKKRILLNTFMENARVYESKENKLLNNFIDEIEAKRALESTQTQPTPKGLFDEVDSSDIIFTDKNGKEHTLTQEVQEQWLKTFNLKSLDEAYTPKLPQDLQEAIGKEIRLTKGSLYKIIEKGREQYIPQIKETLEKPDFALKDSDDMLIIAKEIGDKQYFTSINLETNDYFISISNAPKKENILKNKVENGAKVVYQSPNAKSIFYTDTLLQEGKSPTNKIDSDIIPQSKVSLENENTDELNILKELIETPLQKRNPTSRTGAYRVGKKKQESFR